ncbi:MAG: exosortase/archaeosortase family protein [Candidatus Omnitrophica bacterium]|nr:exosortase/archaeosortase family protein [Candidatus Omnitrophota bacterium]
MKKMTLFQCVFLAALVGLAYIPTFAWMIDRWSVQDTYYSHGFLVPFISAFIVWLKRKELSTLKIDPPVWGWLVFGAGMLTYLLSGILRVYSTSGFSLLIVLPGLILLFWGKDHLKALWFPLSFLLFMVPLPLVVISNMSFKLKIIATQASVFIINAIGVEAIREGSVIKTMHSYVIVEDPCSGIRSLLALIALGALMAYFSRLSVAKKIVLFLSSIPLAVATNIFRIVAVTLASEMYGSKFATGVFHDTMGIVVFVLAFFGLMLVSSMLE